jgi:hypothetical protein
MKPARNLLLSLVLEKGAPEAEEAVMSFGIN